MPCRRSSAGAPPPRPVAGWDPGPGSCSRSCSCGSTPHFYAIAWALRDEYRAAGLRMAGAVGTGGNFLAIQVILFLVVLIPVSLLLTVVGVAGAWYAAGGVLAGLLYLAAGIRFAHRRDRGSSRLLLRASVLYLPAVLVFLVADLNLVRS